MKAEVIVTLCVTVDIGEVGPHDDAEEMASQAAIDAIGPAAKFNPETSVEFEDD